MKRICLEMGTWLMSLACLVCRAETKVPCFIFSGNAGTERSIDLAKFNRITFGDNSLVISSSIDDAEQSVELLYSLYHHLEIGDAIPSAEAGIEGIKTDSDSRLYIDAQAKLLHLDSATDSEFTIGIFNVSGNLLLTSKISNGDSVSLDALARGVYIAVATDGETKLNLKFIIN